MAFCNNPFWTYNPSNKPQNWKAETQDPNRTFFIRHCFTLFTNCRSEQRVIDICHAPNDHNSNSILTAGSVTLNAYLGLRERGSRTLAAANSQGTYRSFSSWSFNHLICSFDFSGEHYIDQGVAQSRFLSTISFFPHFSTFLEIDRPTDFSRFYELDHDEGWDRYRAWVDGSPLPTARGWWEGQLVLRTKKRIGGHKSV